MTSPENCLLSRRSGSRADNAVSSGEAFATVDAVPLTIACFSEGGTPSTGGAQALNEARREEKE